MSHYYRRWHAPILQIYLDENAFGMKGNSFSAHRRDLTLTLSQTRAFSPTFRA